MSCSWPNAYLFLVDKAYNGEQCNSLTFLWWNDLFGLDLRSGYLFRHLHILHLHCICVVLFCFGCFFQNHCTLFTAKVISLYQCFHVYILNAECDMFWKDRCERLNLNDELVNGLYFWLSPSCSQWRWIILINK